MTRKCCAKCRITKCLQIGMKKERIVQRHNEILENFELNQYELRQIDEIKVALRVFEEEQHLEVVGVVPDPVTVCNLPSLYIRRIIKFCKSIDGFRALNKEDQLIMLKRFTFDFMMIRIAFMFDFENQSYYSMAVRAVLDAFCRQIIDCISAGRIGQTGYAGATGNIQSDECLRTDLRHHPRRTCGTCGNGK